MSERVIHHGNPVPIENQRVITGTQREINTTQGNPRYGRFQAPGLQWCGTSAVIGAHLEIEKQSQIGNLHRSSNNDAFVDTQPSQGSSTTSANVNLATNPSSHSQQLNPPKRQKLLLKRIPPCRI